MEMKEQQESWGDEVKFEVMTTSLANIWFR